MPYTFEPKKPCAKAYGTNMRISAKDCQTLCRAVRHKKLSVAKRLLQDLISEKRALGGFYFTKTAKGMLGLLESCEANAKSKGLDAGKLFMHASATNGTNMRRGRRKSGFGSHMRSTNLEIILIERGSGKTESAKPKEIKKIEPKSKEIVKTDVKSELKHATKADTQVITKPVESEQVQDE